MVYTRPFTFGLRRYSTFPQAIYFQHLLGVDWKEITKKCPAAFFGSYMAVSENSGIPKSSILIGFSIKDHPFFGVPLFWKHPYIFTKILGFFCRAYFLVFLRPTLLPVAWGFANRLRDLTNLRDLAREFFGVLETSGRYNQLGYVCIYIYYMYFLYFYIYYIYIIYIYIYTYVCMYTYLVVYIQELH